CLHEGVQAFREAIDGLAAEHKNLIVRHCYSEEAPQGVKRRDDAVSGMINADLIEALVPDRDADYYFCGPKPFMVEIYHQLLGWGVPPAQVRFEFFGPRQELERKAT